MNYCPYCKKPIKPNWEYCYHCKKPLLINLNNTLNSGGSSSFEPKSYDNFSENQSDINLNCSNSLLNVDYLENQEKLDIIHEIDQKIEYNLQNGLPISSLLVKKANLYYLEQDFPSTLKIFEDALKNFQEEKDFLNMGIIYNEIGLIQEDLGYFDISIANFHSSIEIFKKISDVPKLIKVYNNLANVFYIIKDIEESYNCYLIALELAEQQNLVTEYIRISNNIMELFFLLKNYDKINELVQQNLNYFKKVGDPIGFILTLTKMGKLYYFLGQNSYGLSIQILNEALERINNININEDFSLKDRAKIQWEILFYLGKAELALNQTDNAEIYFNKSLEFIQFSKCEDNIIHEAKILESLGQLYQKREEFTKSISYYKAAGEIYYKFGDDPKQAEMKTTIAQLLLNYELSHGEAISFFEEALELYKELNYLKESADIMHILGNIYANKDIVELAISYFQQSREIFKELKDEFNENLLTEKINSLTNLESDDSY